MTIRVFFALTLVALLAAPAIADQWYWFTPQAGVSDGDFVSEVGIPTNTVRISPTSTGDPARSRRRARMNSGGSWSRRRGTTVNGPRQI